MGKCADCRFLSLGNCFTGRLDRAERDYRVSGEAPLVGLPRPGGLGLRLAARYAYTNIPACSIRVRELGAAFANDDLGDPHVVLAYLQAERECPAFVDWGQADVPPGRVSCPESRQRRPKILEILLRPFAAVLSH